LHPGGSLSCTPGVFLYSMFHTRAKNWPAIQFSLSDDALGAFHVLREFDASWFLP
jgi:hypothetical protein